MTSEDEEEEDLEDEPRIFTLEEANLLLDHVRETMAIIQESKREFDRLGAEIVAMEQKGGDNGHSSPISHIEVLRGKALMARGMVEAKLANLRGVGVEVKGIDEGLVDFPSVRDGRLVYLCWKMGESEIAWWHEIDSGFAGRLPL